MLGECGNTLSVVDAAINMRAKAVANGTPRSQPPTPEFALCSTMATGPAWRIACHRPGPLQLPAINFLQQINSLSLAVPTFRSLGKRL